MTAYYNEIDPYAAQWLRNLISAGHIAPGDVDERSIVDVRPSELAGYTQCHFFAGIGVWSYALRLAGWPDDRPVWTGSCPCQPFSAAGKRGGFDDERHLWPHWHWLIRQRRPDVVFGEQVASKDGLAWSDVVQADLEAEGYACGFVDTCSAGSGAPHIRQRLRFVAHADDARREGRLGVSERSGQRAARTGCMVGGMADVTIGGCGEERADAGRQLAGDRAEGLAAGSVPGCDFERLGHPEQLGTGRHAGTGSQEKGGPALRPERDDAGPSGAFRGMADTLRGGAGHGPRQGVGAEAASDGEDGNLSRERLRLGVESASGGTRRPGPTNGFWRDADWLFCRDGKWRPVEPGTFPLAHGAPARVGRLRAYGNAVDAQATRIFIEAYREAASGM